MAVLREYADGDYDFGIDYSVVMSVTGLDLDDSRTLVATLCKNDTGIINSVTFLSTMLLIGDANQRNETGRLEALFSLMDFNNANQISVDELTVMLMCVSSAITTILKTPNEAPSDAQLVKLASAINESKGRKATNPIFKHEFVAYASQYMSGAPGLATVNNVLLLLNGTVTPVMEKKKEEKVEKKMFE